MAIYIDPDTRNYAAKCDVCHDIIDFDTSVDFYAVKEAIESDGWRLQRNNDKWFNIGVDCVTS